MKEQIIFKCYAGSRLYGTNNETSDTDIKGVFLPDLKDLILGTAQKCYHSSTGSGDEKNGKDDTDETYYSLQYFLELLEKGDTNALDLLFAYTNENAVMVCSPIFQEIIRYKDRLLTKNTKAYLGYCKSQAYKYSLKGDKLNDFKKFKEFCLKYGYKDEKGYYLTLEEVLLKEIHYKTLNVSGLDYFNFTESQNLIHLDNKYFDSDNFYVMKAKNKECFLVVHDVKFDFESPMNYLIHKVDNVMKSYGKRAKNAAECNGVDNKAISHCVRVLFQVEELLTEHKITFPLKKADFVKAIKYGDISRDDMMKWIEKKMNWIETELIPSTDLPDKADHELIQQIILYAYGMIDNIQ